MRARIERFLVDGNSVRELISTIRHGSLKMKAFMRHRVTLIPGDGIGTEVALAARRIIRGTAGTKEFTDAVIGALKNA